VILQISGTGWFIGIGEQQITSTTTNTTTFAYTDFVDKAVILHRGLDRLSITEVEKSRIGIDPMQN